MEKSNYRKQKTKITLLLALSHHGLHGTPWLCITSLTREWDLRRSLNSGRIGKSNWGFNITAGRLGLLCFSLAHDGRLDDRNG